MHRIERTVLAVTAGLCLAVAAQAQTKLLRFPDIHGDRVAFCHAGDSWTAPAGDSMLGMWRLVAQGQVRVMEVLVLKQEGDRVVLRFRHFDPGLVAWEDKETPIVLTLTRRATGEARFEGPAVGASGTIALTYRRTGPDSLEATLERGGRTDRFSFTRKR